MNTNTNNCVYILFSSIDNRVRVVHVFRRLPSIYDLGVFICKYNGDDFTYNYFVENNEFYHALYRDYFAWCPNEKGRSYSIQKHPVW
jgi:hypothetical protein